MIAVLAIGLGLVIGVALMGMVHRSIQVSFVNGSSVSITPASLWSSCGAGSSCKILYKASGKEAGTVALHQDFFDEPVIVMPVSNGEKLLCLYEFDVDLRLFRIDPAKPFKPIPATSWGCLDRVLISSPWEVEEADIADWQAALEYLKNLPSDTFMREAVPTHDLGIMRLGVGSESKLNLLQRMEGQIKFMVASGATHWPVNSDTTSSTKR